MLMMKSESIFYLFNHIHLDSANQRIQSTHQIFIPTNRTNNDEQIQMNEFSCVRFSFSLRTFSWSCAILQTDPMTVRNNSNLLCTQLLEGVIMELLKIIWYWNCGVDIVCNGSSPLKWWFIARTSHENRLLSCLLLQSNYHRIINIWANHLHHESSFRIHFVGMVNGVCTSYEPLNFTFNYILINKTGW